MGAIHSHMVPEMDLSQSFALASEADQLALIGLGFVVLAMLALLADRARSKRKRLDRVGWMPWTAIFLACLIIGGGMLALALPPVVASWI